VRATTEAHVVDYVREARESKRPFEIVGAGSKRKLGRPMDELGVLDVSGVAGIIDYQPEVLILTAAPGTPVAEIEAALAEKGQRLGFDPPDWGPLLGAPARLATIGGALSADACGPARLRYGAARDHLLGIRAVNGLGEAFKAGGRVVKNVTGFDIPRLFCGAYGTLGVLTEITLRVFPKPSRTMTLATNGLAPQDGFALLRKIWSSPLEPTGLAYIPAGVFADLADAAVVRIEGEAGPLAEKRALLEKLHPGLVEIESGEALFRSIGSGTLFLGHDMDIWRASVPPAEAARVISETDADFWVADWAGGLLWIAGDEAVRHEALRVGGHATLVRADAATRARVAVFTPQTPVLAQLTQAVKAAFDPLGLFNPGRM